MIPLIVQAISDALVKLATLYTLAYGWRVGFAYLTARLQYPRAEVMFERKE